VTGTWAWATAATKAAAKMLKRMSAVLFVDEVDVVIEADEAAAFL
jgi:hypothetical protein